MGTLFLCPLLETGPPLYVVVQSNPYEGLAVCRAKEYLHFSVIILESPSNGRAQELNLWPPTLRVSVEERDTNNTTKIYMYIKHNLQKVWVLFASCSHFFDNALSNYLLHERFTS